MSAFNGLAEVLLKLSERMSEAADGVSFAFGQVVRGEGLTVQLESRLLLPSDVLVLTDPVIESVEPILDENDRPTGVYNVLDNLSIGDRVLLAKIQGGQYYVILSKCYAVESDSV
ncbi:MAG TPA: DUF2577 family protein [Candidatus Avidehalobacter gallistercoris]|uniref:DUF2577 family protein n=1 Tax=Candidatus Avidehalobacter gallistercoris TaxID=2840694 RepID=A0A9D1HLN6_9FIRM|nr:DUF2577 family protein [Candidatus Avidehalobacter gallistercoris]